VVELVLDSREVQVAAVDILDLVPYTSVAAVAVMDTQMLEQFQ
tara:strand:- start:394 stop:522 length:129 start_codon:yes stop_codon:yes gene_type:complete